MKRIAALCLLAFELVSGCHAASPSLSSFDQTYFTTNNLFISLRTNWISTNSITTLIVTNLYVTNLYSTNIIVNGTNVATFGDLLWTNISNVLQPLVGTSVRTTNHTVRAVLNVDGAFVLGSIAYAGGGDIDVATTNDGTILVFPSTSTPTDTTVHLAHGRGTGQIMTIVNASSSGGAFRMLNGDPTTDVPSTYLRLNGDWVSTNKGDALLLIHAGPFWSEAARMAGSTNIASPTIINPTLLYSPVKIGASEFGDSPMHVPAIGDTNAIFDGAIYVGPNSYGFWGASDYSIVSIHDIDQDEPNNNGIAIWTVSGNLNGAIDGNVTTNIAVLSVGVANGNVGSSVVWTGAQTNLFLDGQFGTNNPSVFKLHPTVEDISANAAYTLDTPTWQLKTAADLLRIKNAGTNMLAVGPTGQIIFGPGTTNLLYRSGSDFVLENDDTTGFELLLKDVSGSASYGVNGNGAPKITSTVVGQPVILNAGGESDGLTVTTTSLQPGTETMAIGANSSNGAWVEQYFKGTLRQQGVNDGAGNRTLLEITHRGNAGDIELKSNAAGTQTFRPIAVMVGSTNVAKFDTTSAAGETRFWLYDEDNGTMERVTVGIADSGGAGFKLLRIPN